jgi:hypothetical protein
MSDSNFTPEIFEQKEVAERECQKLQALLDEQMPNCSFIFAPEDDELIILSNSVYDKFKRPREEIVIHEDDNDDDNEDDNDDDNEDDDDVPEVKPKQSSSFKRHEDNNDEDDEDEVGELLDNELLQAFDPVTWGMEPQSPWSQHEEAAEQNTLVVPLATEPVPNLYTPQGVGLCFLILSFILFF